MKKLNSFLRALLIFCLCLSIFAPAALASFGLSMPAEIKLKGENNPKLSFVLELKALTPAAPLPQGSENGVYILKFSGPGKLSFPEIVFSNPGDFKYQITQKNLGEKYCTYDDTVYIMEVIAQQSPQGLMQTVVISKSGQSEKAGEIVFNNSYDPPPEPKPFPQTGDGENILMYLGFGAFSVLMLAFIFTKLKKDKRN